MLKFANMLSFSPLTIDISLIKSEYVWYSLLLPAIIQLSNSYPDSGVTLAILLFEKFSSVSTFTILLTKAPSIVPLFAFDELYDTKY